jgi:hypothetical protein
VDVKKSNVMARRSGLTPHVLGSDQRTLHRQSTATTTHLYGSNHLATGKSTISARNNSRHAVMRRTEREYVSINDQAMLAQGRHITSFAHQRL